MTETYSGKLRLSSLFYGTRIWEIYNIVKLSKLKKIFWIDSFGHTKLCNEFWIISRLALHIESLTVKIVRTMESNVYFRSHNIGIYQQCQDKK